jgi:hypothetical protein
LGAILNKLLNWNKELAWRRGQHGRDNAVSRDTASSEDSGKGSQISGFGKKQIPRGFFMEKLLSAPRWSGKSV